MPPVVVPPLDSFSCDGEKQVPLVVPPLDDAVPLGVPPLDDDHDVDGFRLPLQPKTGVRILGSWSWGLINRTARASQWVLMVLIRDK